LIFFSSSTRSSFAWTADFVQKKSAPPRRLEQSFAISVRTGESSLAVAEELALQQGFGNGSAVDGDKRTGAASAGGVDRPRRNLLANTAFTADEDRRVSRSHPPDHLPKRAGRLRIPDELLLCSHDCQGLLQGLILPGEFLFPGGSFDDLSHDVEIEGFLQEIHRTPAHRLHSGLYVTVSGENHHSSVGAGLPHRVEHGQPVHRFHAQVGEHHVETLVLHQFDGFGAAVHTDDVVSTMGECGTEQHHDLLLVVNYQNPRHVWNSFGSIPRCQGQFQGRNGAGATFAVTQGQMASRFLDDTP